VAQGQVPLERRAPKVEIAVFHPDLIPTVTILLNGEWWQFGRAKQLKPIGQDLDVPGGQVWVLIASLGDYTESPDYELPPEGTGLTAEVGVALHVENQLRYSVTVAQVDKGHPPKITRFLDPSGQGDAFTTVTEP
jgi:hypothetical protein